MYMYSETFQQSLEVTYDAVFAVNTAVILPLEPTCKGLVVTSYHNNMVVISYYLTIAASHRTYNHSKVTIKNFLRN